MPDRQIERAIWSTFLGHGGHDIHLVRFGSQPAGQKNSSSALRSMLLYAFTNGELAFVPSGMATFTTNLPGSLARYGIELDSSEGIITLAAAPPTVTIRNFIVIAAAQHASGTRETRIRVHIHDRLNKAYLVPAPALNLRIGSQARLTVLADFDDQTVGDISRDPDIAWEVLEGGLEVSTTLPEPGFRGLGFIRVSTALVGESGKIRARLPSRLGGTPGVQSFADASIKVLPAWGDIPLAPPLKDPYRATLITGPTTVLRSDPDVRNVLFLPEGFTQSQRGLFEQIADAIALDEFSSSSVFRPFDLLNERINYYRLWVEPSETHSECINELSSLYAPAFIGLPLPFPEDPPTNGISTVAHLVFRVGLPAPQDVTDATTVQQQMATWTATYGAGFVTFADALDS
jgi:hypothetical protein